MHAQGKRAMNFRVGPAAQDGYWPTAVNETFSASLGFTGVKSWFTDQVIAIVEVGGTICTISSQPPGSVLDGQKLLVMKNPLIPNCISQHDGGKINAIHHVEVCPLKQETVGRKTILVP